MPETPLAYFLTFSTYGTRLHGDVRGSVDRRSNWLDGPMLPRDDFRRHLARRLMRSEPVRITPARRAELEWAFAEAAAIKEWRVIALNIRTEHVHAVIEAPEPPERVVSTLKAAGTRRLRERSLIEPDQPVWARHGSTRYLWTEGDVSGAAHYVANEQGADLPGSGTLHRLWKEAD